MPSNAIDVSTRRVGYSPPSMTVIVQGPVNHPEANWDRCIDSIHQNIPHARVLVVQWLGDSRDVNAPRLLLEDPGPSISENGYVSNLQRQVLGVSSALELVETEFVLKMRPDFYITKPCQFTDPSNLGNLIRTLNVWTFDPASRERFFWISDLIQLARTKILQSYWSISNLEVETQLAAKRAPFWKYELGGSDMSMSSEQLLTKSFLVRAGHEVELDKCGRIKPSRKNFDLAQDVLSRYFEIVHWNASGLFVPNRFRLMNSFLVLNAPLKSGGFFCARLRHLSNKERAVNFVSGLLRAVSAPIWRKVRHRYLVQKGAILR